MPGKFLPSQTQGSRKKGRQQLDSPLCPSLLAASLPPATGTCSLHEFLISVSLFIPTSPERRLDLELLWERGPGEPDFCELVISSYGILILEKEQ